MTRPEATQDQDTLTATGEAGATQADALSGAVPPGRATVVLHPRVHQFLLRLTRGRPRERLYGLLYGRARGGELHVEAAALHFATMHVYRENPYAQGWHAGWDAAMHEVLNLDPVGNWTLLGAHCDPLATYTPITGDPAEVAALYVDEVRLYAEMSGESHLERTFRYLAYLIAPAGEVTAQVPVVRASRFFPSPTPEAPETS